jgi:trk system potassium uptake protein TrkH
MRPHIIIRQIGVAVVVNSIFLFVSFLISAFNHEPVRYILLYCSFITLIIGIFPFIFVPGEEEIIPREAYLIVFFSWIISCVIGMLPYLMWGGEFSFINAWFESVSGYTTTGSTILADIEALPKGLLFWRSATHWIGGLGIIIFVLAVLPSKGFSTALIYRIDQSNLSLDNYALRARNALNIMIYVYVGFTLAETLLLWVFGMSLFDAVTHSFGTIATGGFSTRNMSIAYFDSVGIEIIIIFFMLISGIHFGLIYNTLTGRKNRIWNSYVVKYYLVAMVIGTVIVAINLHGDKYNSWGEAFRHASFQVASLGTTTGFASADSAPWPGLSILILLFFTIQCAGAGSTSGGMKVDRIVIFWKQLRRHMKKLQHPNAVIPIKLGRNTLDEDVIDQVLTFIIMYLLIILISTLILTTMDVDLLTAFSGSAATLGNVGPGFNGVSSLGNFKFIPALGKLVLTINMLLGRLEIFSVFYLISLLWKRR